MRDRLTGWSALGALLLFFGSGICCPALGGETLTDPTQPPVTTLDRAVHKGRKPPQWRLTSTITGPGRRVAVINGQVVQIGEPIDGAVLIKVAPGGAVLTHQGRSVHLKVNAKIVKRSVKAAP